MSSPLTQILTRSTASAAVAGACTDQAVLADEASSLLLHIAQLTEDAERATRRQWPQAGQLCAVDLASEVEQGIQTLPGSAERAFEEWLACERLLVSCLVIKATNTVRSVGLVRMHLACAGVQIS